MVVSATDAVVVVVPSGLAWPEVVGADLRILEQHGTRVLGTVLTAAAGTSPWKRTEARGRRLPRAGEGVSSGPAPVSRRNRRARAARRLDGRHCLP